MSGKVTPKMGPKPKPVAEKRRNLVAVKMTDSEREILKRRSRGKSVSDYLREKALS